jgi:adenosylcobinamide amidohydrolase
MSGNEASAVASTMNRPFIVRDEQDTLVLSFTAPARVLSWAVLNGGLCDADHVINHHVNGDDQEFCADPQRWLEESAVRLGLQGTVVALATAVEMKNLVEVSFCAGGNSVILLCDCRLQQCAIGRRPLIGSSRANSLASAPYDKHDTYSSSGTGRSSFSRCFSLLVFEMFERCDSIPGSWMSMRMSLGNFSAGSLSLSSTVSLSSCNP